MVSMLGAEDWLGKIMEFFIGFFAFIPQTIYFIYASCASFLDFLQYLIRKLAGLDVYYVDGVAQTGDFLTEFISGILGIKDSGAQYSALGTVFWSMIIFGCILLVVTTIIQVIKTHFNYDSSKSHPMTIIRGSIKSLFTMAIVPIVAFFGFYLSNIVLKTLDNITSYASESNLSSIYDSAGLSKFEKGTVGREADSDAEVQESYASYDFFGAGTYTNNPSFSGVLFKIAGYSCNRVRTGSFPMNKEWSDLGIFKSNTTDKEISATRIDTAFANNLTLKTPVSLSFSGSAASLSSSFVVGFAYSVGASNVTSFSKFNVGAVWYYYDLWTFNWLLAFAGVILFVKLLFKIVFGLITRLIQLMAMFLVFPPLIGIMPLDNGNAYNKWKGQFIQDILMVFGAVIGMNIFFLLLPYLNTISFFNNKILDLIFDAIIMLAGLVLVEKFIGIVSGFIGGSDASSTGEKTMKDTLEIGQAATVGMMKAVTVGASTLSVGKTVGSKVASSLGRTSRVVGFAASQDQRDIRFMNRLLKKEKENVFISGSSFDVEGKLVRRENESDEDYARRDTATKDYLANNKEFQGRIERREARQNRLNNRTKEKTSETNNITRTNNISSSIPNARTVHRGKNQGQVLSGGVDNGTLESIPSPAVEESAPVNKFKAIGKGLLDLGNDSLKLAKDLTGVSDLMKEFEKSGLLDSTNEAVRDLFGVFGQKTKPVFETKKVKEKKEKENAPPKDDRVQEAILETMKDTNSQLTAILNAVKNSRSGPSGGTNP